MKPVSTTISHESPGPAPSTSAAPAAGGLPPIPTVRPRTRRSRWRRRFVMLFLALAATGAGYLYRDQIQAFLRPYTTGLPRNSSVQTYVVHRADFIVAIQEDGKLHGLHNEAVMLGVNGKITWLAQPGAKVKKGDLLVTIEKKQFEDQRFIAAGELDTARRSLVIATEAIPIAKSKATAEIAAAKT